MLGRRKIITPIAIRTSAQANARISKVIDTRRQEASLSSSVFVSDETLASIAWTGNSKDLGLQAYSITHPSCEWYDCTRLLFPSPCGPSVAYKAIEEEVQHCPVSVHHSSHTAQRHLEVTRKLRALLEKAIAVLTAAGPFTTRPS